MASVQCYICYESGTYTDDSGAKNKDIYTLSFRYCTESWGWVAFIHSTYIYWVTFMELAYPLDRLWGNRIDMNTAIMNSQTMKGGTHLKQPPRKKICDKRGKFNKLWEQGRWTNILTDCSGKTSLRENGIWDDTLSRVEFR